MNFLSKNINKINFQEQGVHYNRLNTFLNPYSYLLARKNSKVFDNFDKIYLDGIALVKIFKLFGLADVNRTSFDMTSLASVVFSDAIKTRKSLYFIGTKPEVISQAVKNIKITFPDLNVVGYKDGYFSDDEERYLDIININKLNPDIVICGMATPLQEQFLVDLKNSGWNGTGYTCGGFLHQTARSIQYYPKWVNRYNLRWAYRIYDEPKLFKRYFWEYPKFIFIFLYDYYTYKINI